MINTHRPKSNIRQDHLTQTLTSISERSIFNLVKSFVTMPFWRRKGIGNTLQHIQYQQAYQKAFRLYQLKRLGTVTGQYKILLDTYIFWITHLFIPKPNPFTGWSKWFCGCRLWFLYLMQQHVCCSLVLVNLRTNNWFHIYAFWLPDKTPECSGFAFHCWRLSAFGSLTKGQYPHENQACFLTPEQGITHLK